MFRLLQMDPDTLAMNVNVSGLHVSPYAEKLYYLLEELSVGNYESANHFINLHAEDKLVYPALVELYSSYIHELRHYFDLAITPFGWYRLRTVFEFFTLAPAILSEEENLILPLAANRDEIYREAFGLPPMPHSLTSVALRSTFTRYDGIKKHNEKRGFYPTADNILEALAFITQFELILNEHHTKSVVQRMGDFFAPIAFNSGKSIDVRYRWFVPFVRQLHSGEVIPNNRLMYAILFASLCGSIPLTVTAKPFSELEQGSASVHRDVSEQMPDNRFIKLFEYFIEKKLPSLSSDAEAFELVQDACKKLFGKTLIEEILEDIEETEKIQRNVIVPNSGGGFLNNKIAFAFADLINVRKELLKRLVNNSEYYLSSKGFSERCINELRPSLIFWAPQGLSHGDSLPSRYRKSWVGLVDRHYSYKYKGRNQDICNVYAFWSPLRGENYYDKSILDVEVNDEIKDDFLSGRQFLYAVYTHLGNYLCYGHNAPVMCEVSTENILPLLRLSREGDINDPAFHQVERVYPADDFARYSERQDLICDVCNTKVHYTAGSCVSARTMRQSKNARIWSKTLQDDVRFQLFKLDWSDWFLCGNCLDDFELQRPISEEQASEGIIAYTGLKLDGSDYDSGLFAKEVDRVFRQPTD